MSLNLVGGLSFLCKATFPDELQSPELPGDTHSSPLTSVSVRQGQESDMVQACVPGIEEVLLLGHHL